MRPEPIVRTGLVPKEKPIRSATRVRPESIRASRANRSAYMRRVQSQSDLD